MGVVYRVGGGDGAGGGDSKQQNEKLEISSFMKYSVLKKAFYTQKCTKKDICKILIS